MIDVFQELEMAID